MEHHIIVVGIGPGSPDYIVPAASRAIEQASVLVGSARALATFAKGEICTKVIDGDIDGVLRFLAEKITDNNVVVMVSGDPGFYSLLAAIRTRFTAEQVQVIPGISSMQMAFCRIAEPWQDAQLISLHGRTQPKDVLNYQAGKKLGFLTDSIHNPRQIAALLISGGWPIQSPTWLCTKLSYDDEEVIATTLGEALTMDGFTHSVMVVKA